MFEEARLSEENFGPVTPKGLISSLAEILGKLYNENYGNVQIEFGKPIDLISLDSSLPEETKNRNEYLTTQSSF